MSRNMIPYEGIVYWAVLVWFKTILVIVRGGAPAFVVRVYIFAPTMEVLLQL